LDYESHATGLDRSELGALLVAAGLSSARDHALVSLLALNGLRISEALGADIETLGLERGHRTLTVTRKGGKIVTLPLAPRTARAVDLAIGERMDGPIFLGADGARLDRHAAGRIVRRVARRAGITKRVGPHTLRHAFITAALDAGVPLRDVQEAASHADPRTTMRYDRGRVSLDRHLHRRHLRGRRCPLTTPGLPGTDTTPRPKAGTVDRCGPLAPKPCSPSVRVDPAGSSHQLASAVQAVVSPGPAASQTRARVPRRGGLDQLGDPEERCRQSAVGLRRRPSAGPRQ
jgi:hypothetical protein